MDLAVGDADAAVEHFGRALGRRPADLSLRRDLAGALLATGRADDALALLEGAVEVHPDDAELTLELARTALEAGHAEVAEEAARRALDSLPATDPRPAAALGAAFAAQHRADDAETAFGEALRRDPDDLAAQQGLRALRAAGEADALPHVRGAARQLARP